MVFTCTFNLIGCGLGCMCSTSSLRAVYLPRYRIERL
jgi:hypothetical protein